MANTDKNVLITPNIGSSTAAPKIELTGADGTGSDKITLTSSFDGSVSTLSFEGTAGQLFSISNLDSDGDENLFAVNDKSGIPSLQVATDGTVILNPNSGRVLIGTAVDDGVNQLQVDGTLSVSGTFINSGDISFGDNAKAIFGTGSDLQIYSNGTSSYIIEGGSGNLEIRATDIFLKSADNTKALATFDADGAASISYNGSSKLATTSTGISVTGDVATTASIAKTNGGAILKTAISAWTIPNNDILYYASSSNNGDYLYLKVPENGSTGHPTLAMTEQGGLFYGTWDNESGALFDVTTAPITNNLFRIDTAGNVTISGDLTVAGAQTSTGTAELNVTDVSITLNSGETGPGITAPAGISGIYIDRGPQSDSAEWLFNESLDKWTSNFPLAITGGASTFTGGSVTVTSDGTNGLGAEINLKHANNNTNDVVSTVNFSNNIGSVARIQGGTVGANNSGYIDFFTDSAGTDGFVARMLPNGNVGIGTTTPANLLEISDSTTGDAQYLNIHNVGGGAVNDETSIQFQHGSTRRSSRISSTLTSSTTTNLLFSTESSGNVVERMRIDASGDVSIGTIAGTVEKLSVKSTGTQDGQIILEHSGNTTPIVQIGQSNNHGSIKISTNGGVVNTYLGASANENYINASTRSNLGVGTTNPDELLHVFDSFNNTGTETTLGTNNSRATIKVENDAAQQGVYASLFLRAGTADARIAVINTGGATNDTADLVFIVDDTVNQGTERMRIVGETGNVGIGTDSPATALHVKSTAAVTATIEAGGGGDAVLDIKAAEASGAESIIRFSDSVSGVGFITYAQNDGGSDYMRFGTASTERMRIDASGALLLHPNNATRGLKITTTQTVAVGDTTTYNTVGAGYGQHIFQTDGIERLRIDSDGKILIGTTHNSVYNSSTQAHAGALIDGLNDNIQVARWESTPLFVNRMSTNGDLVDFRFDGETVGIIGTDSNRLTIGTDDTGLIFSSLNYIRPWNPTANTEADTDISLGGPNDRFKNLYLSGTNYSNGLTINQSQPYTPAHFKAAGIASAPTDVLTIETYRTDVSDAFTGGSIVFVNSDTNSAGQARIKVGSTNDSNPATNPIGLNNEVAQSFIFETSTGGNIAATNIDGNATTITVTHAAYTLLVGQRIAITDGTYAGSYTIDTVLSNTQFTIADTAHDLAADTTPRVVQFGVRKDSMIIRSDGNVGIGTNVPKQKVHSTNGFYTTGGIASPGTPPYASYSGASFDWFDGYARLASWGADATTRGGYSFIQMQSDGESQQTAMTIDASGKVGIGTSSPSFKLHVSHDVGDDASFTGGILVENTGTGAGEPNIAFKNQATGSNYWFTGLNQDTNYALSYGTSFEDPNNLFTLTSGGNLGVGGVVDPNERLVVTGSANGGSTAIVVQNEYSLASSVDESTDLQFRFYIDASDIYTSGAMIRSTKTEDWMTTAAASAELVFYTRKDNVLARKMTLDPSGNLLIGASGVLNTGNQVAIQPTGHIRAQHATGEAGDTIIGAITGVSNGFQIIHDTSDNQTYKFHTGGVESLGILPTGYVRINGTSGPTLFGTEAVATTTSSTEVYSFDKTLYGGAKFIVTIEDSNGTDRQIVELLVVHDGTNAFSTQYGSVLTTGTELATFDVDINGNNVRLLASGHTANSHQYHTSAHLMAL